MQCPRCGSENAPDARACSRCGLPVPQSGPPPNAPDPGLPQRPGQPPGPAGSPPSPFQQPPSPYQQQPSPYQQQPYPPSQGEPTQQIPTGQYPSQTQQLSTAAVHSRSSERSGLVTAAIAFAVIGALAALGYGGFALTLRRGIYADLDDDPTSVSKSDAENSDNINALGLWVAGLLVGLAFVLLIAAMISARRGRNGLGYTGAVLVVLGALAATWGCLQVSGVDDVANAGDAVSGYLIAGPGFIVMAIGLLLGALGLRRPVRPAPTPQAQFPQNPYGSGGAQDPYRWSGESYGISGSGGSQRPQGSKPAGHF
jgi:zinc-ribbon domain